MAEGILGLGSSGSTGLSQELIDKLKAAEAKGKVDPYDESLEKWELELEKMDEINVKVNELLAAVNNFDLYKSGSNAFEQVTASTTGTAALFDAIDISGLEDGTSSVNITQLAQKDVYQTAVFGDPSIQVVGGNDSGDKLSINIAGTTYDFSTVGKTYEDLASDINKNIAITASVEQVGDNSYRLVIKSLNSGEANKLTITQDGISLGIDSQVKSQEANNTAVQIIGGNDSGDKITLNGIDFTTNGKSYELLADDINSHSDFNASVSNNQIVITRVDGSDVEIMQTGVDLGFTSAILSAKNMKAEVDGVNYDVSSNTITIQGNLTMTALELGTSTISVQKDSSSILPGLKDFTEKYNELLVMVNDELYNADSSIEDPSSLRIILSQIKNSIFDTYGTNDDLNVFNYGFDVDASGFINIDEEKLGIALTENLADIKSLFIGVAEKPGLGTVLKEYLDSLDGFDGLLTTYGSNMVSRKTVLETEREEAQEFLDTKYSQMSLQFASYTAIISQMEASFGGMKLMMEQSTAG